MKHIFIVILLFCLFFQNVEAGTSVAQFPSYRVVKKPMPDSSKSDGAIFGLLLSLHPPLFGALTGIQLIDDATNETTQKYNKQTNRLPDPPETTNFLIGLSVFNLAFSFIDSSRWWMGTAVDLLVAYYPSLFGLSVYEREPMPQSTVEPEDIKVLK